MKYDEKIVGTLYSERTQHLRSFFKLLLKIYTQDIQLVEHNRFTSYIYSMRDKKNAGDEWEELVAQYYQKAWYHLIEKKYTIKGWEIDLIFQKENTLYFIEVKVVNNIEDLQNYVTTKKIGHVKHTIAYYLLTHPTDKEYVLDVVFVRNNAILHIYNNVTNS